MVISSNIAIISITGRILIPAILLLTLSSITIKWLQSRNPWVSLIFTLAFLGGIMIIFIYIVSSLTQMKSSETKKPVALIFLPIFIIWFNKADKSTSYSSSLIENFPTIYFTLCILILTILMISSKVIKSPFKALKGAF